MRLCTCNFEDVKGQNRKRLSMPMHIRVCVCVCARARAHACVSLYTTHSSAYVCAGIKVVLRNFRGIRHAHGHELASPPHELVTRAEHVLGAFILQHELALGQLPSSSQCEEHGENGLEQAYAHAEGQEEKETRGPREAQHKSRHFLFVSEGGLGQVEGLSADCDGDLAPAKHVCES